MDATPGKGARREIGVILFALLFPTLVTLLYFVVLASAAPAIQQTAYALGKCIQFGLPAFWVFAAGRQPPRRIRPARSGLAVNLIFGAAVAGLAMVLYRLWLHPSGYLAPASLAGQAILEKVHGFGVDNVWKYAALGTFYAVIHSGLEEYYWRWFVFVQIRRAVPIRLAILVSSLGFMLHHVILLGVYFDWAFVPTALFSLAVAMGGGVWAWLYHQSGSLVGPWLSHMLVDAGIFLVGYDLVRGTF